MDAHNHPQYQYPEADEVHKRVELACLNCRRKKVKCLTNSQHEPCMNCQQHEWQCEYQRLPRRKPQRPTGGANVQASGLASAEQDAGTSAEAAGFSTEPINLYSPYPSQDQMAQHSNAQELYWQNPHYSPYGGPGGFAEGSMGGPASNTGTDGRCWCPPAEPCVSPAAADGGLAEKYEQLVDAVTDTRLAEAAKALVSGATFLVASAGIAALISTVQIGFFVAIGFPGCTPLDNSACTPSGQRTVYAILFFSFLGLCVDAVGGFFCVMKAGKLLSASNLAEDVLARKATLERRFLRGKRGATRQRQASSESPPRPSPSPSSESLLATPQPDLLAQTTHLLAKVHTTTAHLRTHDNFHKNGSLFVLVGMTFFVVALMTQAIAALPRDWAVAFIVGVCAIGAGLVWMEGVASGVWVPRDVLVGGRGRQEKALEIRMDRMEP
uniref:Zn(2)-C6 fungal-type domain-containing protein n=1 Tax=Mycena chlorophos TaxID=658473 RepID=A0ABQ0M6R8_MYCCL|nr:predicted protein [Mycena chlorophos]